MSKLILSYLFKTNLATFRSAIFDDNTDKICRILDIERDYLNKQIDSNGNTALILAILYASPLTVRLLLEQGAQADQPNEITLQTPLTIIASQIYEDFNSYKAQKKIEMAKILLDHGAYVDKPSLRVYRDQNNKDYIGKETPLMTSVRKRNLPLTKLLIEKKANVNYVERQSQIRAIHYAVTNGDEEMFDLLVNAGALCCSIVTGGDNNLLHWFCYKKENDNHINLLEKILDQGCDINAQNWEERTPLMIAIKSNMIETCRIFLKNKVDITKQDSNGNQAIDLSIPGSECSKLLLQQIKASPHINSNGKIIWKQRLDIEKNEINNQSKCLDNEKHINRSPYVFIYAIQRRTSEDSEKKCERAQEKNLETNSKRRILRKLHRSRSQSVDMEVKFSK